MRPPRRPWGAARRLLGATALIGTLAITSLPHSRAELLPDIDHAAKVALDADATRLAAPGEASTPTLPGAALAALGSPGDVVVPVGLPAAPVIVPVAEMNALRPDLAAIRDAVTAYRRQDIAAGDRIRAQASEPDARALLDWAAIRFGGPQVPFDRIEAFAQTYPAWPTGSWLRRRGEEALLAERRPPEAVRAFFAAEAPRTGGGKIALALALKASPQPGDGAKLVRDAWRNDPLSPELEAKVLDGFPDVLVPADHRARTERQLMRENWDGARRAAALAGKGYDLLVKVRISVDQRVAAAAKLMDSVPAALRTDPSYMFSRAQWLRRSDKYVDAAKAMAEAPRDPASLVDGDAWWAERKMIARKLLDTGEVKLAYAVTAAHGAVSPEKQIEAEFQAGWIALRFLKDNGLAAKHFKEAAAISATPISVSRMAYWQGRAAEAAGEAAAAEGFFERAAQQPTTYYGQLAGAKLGRPQVAIRSPIDPTAPERLEAGRGLVASAVSLLYAAGLRDAALPLVTDIARSSRSIAELDAVGDVVLAFGDARALLALGKGATQRGLALDHEAFPTIGVPSFEATGDRVEKAMVYAIARQESAFDPAAGSNVGARGLMQLMPATARQVAQKLGLDFDVGRLLDGAYNARLGAAHLGELMGDWKGSYILTFASYNAGAGNVKKWVQAYGDPRDPAVDPVDWVERIPFSETRNYVQRVMENLQVYRKRLDERSALVIDSDLKRGGTVR